MVPLGPEEHPRRIASNIILVLHSGGSHLMLSASEWWKSTDRTVWGDVPKVVASAPGDRGNPEVPSFGAVSRTSTGDSRSLPIDARRSEHCGDYSTGTDAATECLELLVWSGSYGRRYGTSSKCQDLGGSHAVHAQ